MFDAALWGLVQGLTEFLPISSSGHLVLVPELLGREPPSLATSAVLHLGTLAALLVYFRAEIAAMVRRTPEGRRLLRWLAIGTVPAAIGGILFRSRLTEFNDSPRLVAAALFLTGVALLATRAIRPGSRRLVESSNADALLIGTGQAIALIPGVSRSGATIGAGLALEFDRTEAARYAFLLGIPAIAAAGLIELVELAGEPGGIPGSTWVGLVVAAVSGYVAIAALLRLIGRAGLAPFGLYCIAAGGLAFVLV